MPRLDAPARLELFKLLLRVVWADQRVLRTEIELIRDLASKLGVSASENAQIERWLGRQDPLPEPDIELLRQHHELVMAAVWTATHVDDQVSPEEEAILRELQAQLTTA